MLAKPARLPPFVLEPHEVRTELDVDWAICPEDWHMELNLRQVRNKMIKEKLQQGRSVVYRSSGWSLWPRVSSGDNLTYNPVTKDSQVEEGDIVFCEVQPCDRFYAHVVKSKTWSDRWAHYVYMIANLKGRGNGWCYIVHIYGRMVHCEA